MKVILMYSEKHNKDMWWVEDGDIYHGPYDHRKDAIKAADALLAALQEGK